MAASGWKRRFDETIPLPRGRELVTLQDAGNFITKPPKAEHEAPEWQATMEALILVATHGGPTMFARINDAGAGSWTGTAMSVIAPVGSRFWIVGPKTGAARCGYASRTMFAFGVLWYCTCFSRFSRRFTVI
jgi:hypothetical protein